MTTSLLLIFFICFIQIYACSYKETFYLNNKYLEMNYSITPPPVDANCNPNYKHKSNMTIRLELTNFRNKVTIDGNWCYHAEAQYNLQKVSFDGCICDSPSLPKYLTCPIQRMVIPISIPFESRPLVYIPNPGIIDAKVTLFIRGTSEIVMNATVTSLPIS